MQDKIKQNQTFLQDLERLKVERQINDQEAAALIGCTPTYLSQIRGEKRNAGPKVRRSVKYYLDHPSVQLREKSNAYQIDAPTGLPFELDKEVQAWSHQCGLAPKEFVARCIMNYGRKFRDELLNSPDVARVKDEREADHVARVRADQKRREAESGAAPHHEQKP